MQQEFLTPKELEILQLVANGLTNCQIAEKLKLSPRTVITIFTVSTGNWKSKTEPGL